MAYRNFTDPALLQQYLNQNFAMPTDTGIPVQNKLYQQPYNMFNVAGEGITSIPTNINQQPFNDYYGPTNIDTSFGVANEPDDEEDVEGATKKGGLADLFKTILGFAVPGASLLMGGGQKVLGGIQNLNQRLRNTEFARSETLQEYFDRRSRAKNAARMAEKYQDFSERTSGAGATGGDRDFSTPAGKSTSYEQASRAFGIGR